MMTVHDVSSPEGLWPLACIRLGIGSFQAKTRIVGG